MTSTEVSAIWDVNSCFGTTKEFIGTLKMYITYKTNFYIVNSSQYVYKERGSIIGATINMDFYNIFENESKGLIEWLPEISKEEVYKRARNFIKLENLDYSDFYK